VGTIPKDLATLIVFVCFASKTTHAFQPTAMSFFTNCFYKQAATFMENIGCSFTNVDFLKLFYQTWMKAPVAVNTVSNFRKPSI